MTVPNSTSAATAPAQPRPWEISVDPLGPDTYLVRLAGSWRLRDHLPRASEVVEKLRSIRGVRRLSLDTTQLRAWDTGLLTFLRNLFEESAKAEFDVDRSGLPTDVERLLSLASAVPVRTTPEPAGPPWLGRTSASVFAAGAGAMEVLAFTGEVCAAVAGVVTGRVRIRWFQFALLVEEVGVRALPIMTLIGTLIGIILAFGGGAPAPAARCADLRGGRRGNLRGPGGRRVDSGDPAGREDRGGLRRTARLDAGE